MIYLRVEDLLGKKTLIIGDVGRGKTLLTLKIILKLIEIGLSEELTVLDFAPNKIEIDGDVIGGKLVEFSVFPFKVKYYTDRIFASRLMGRNSVEVLNFARLNRRACDGLLRRYLRNPSSILVINDITLYFQVDDLGLLPRVLEKSKTFIANGYYGERLMDDKGSSVSLVERRNLLDLIGMMDLVIDLNVVDYSSIFNNI